MSSVKGVRSWKLKIEMMLYVFDLNVSSFRPLRKVEGSFVCFHHVASTFLGDRNFDICNATTRVNIHVQSTWPCKLPPRGGLSVCTHRMQTVVPALNLISQNSTSTAFPTFLSFLVLNVLADHLFINAHRIHTIPVAPEMVAPVGTLPQI